MSCLFYFILGIIVGGTVMVIIMSAIQIRRVNEFNRKIN